MSDYGYGLWFLVVVNTAMIMFFAATAFHPRNKRVWRATQLGHDPAAEAQGAGR